MIYIYIYNNFPPSLIYLPGLEVIRSEVMFRILLILFILISAVYSIYTMHSVHTSCIEYLDDTLGLAKTEVQYENTAYCEEYCLPQCNAKDFHLPVLQMN